jgi:glycosyltransferase involved in cell wall biosynthesis
MPTPKVSIIIPVYNCQKYLSSCLNSVLNQSLKEIEIICINDGSTDSSLDILKAYATKDNRFVIIDQKNSGTAASRNKGIEIAKGEYIGFVDNDDFIEENHYEDLYTQSQKENADMAIGLANITPFSGQAKRSFSSEEIVFHKFHNISLNKNFSFSDPWCSIFRLNFIKQNDIKFNEQIVFSIEHEFYVKAKVYSKNTISVISTAYHWSNEIDNQQTQILNHEKYECIFKSRQNIFSFINSIDLDKKDYLNIFSAYIETLCWYISTIIKDNKFSKDEQHFFFDYAYKIFQQCKYMHELKENLFHPLVRLLDKKDFNAFTKFSKNPSSSKLTKQFLKYYVSMERYLQIKQNHYLHFNEEVYISAVRVLTVVKKYLLQINSVLDMDGNSGLWLRAWKDIMPTGGIDFKNKCDLVLSLGQTEKLNEQDAINHIDKLTQLSDTILFCPEHRNENLNISSAIKKPPAFWSYQFRQRGFICFDIIRKKVWDDPWVSKEYKQGVLLYIKESAAQVLLNQGLKPVDTPSTFYTQDFIEALTDSALKKLKKYRKYYQTGFIVSAILLITLIIASFAR